MRKISLVTSMVLLSSTIAMADSNSIKEAFANGKTSGDVTVYFEDKDAKGTSTDSGFTSGSVGLNYETDTFKGFTASFGFRANHEFDEDNRDVDYKAAYKNDAIMNVAALKYATDDFFISVGRQEIDLEWLGDFNESVVAGITAVPNTTIVLGYTDRKAEVGIDVVENFTDVNGKKGAYVVDVKNTSIENLELNPYFYSAPDVADFYGLKVSYDTDMFGATAHYAKSNEDTQSDGDIYNLEGRLNVVGVSLAAGYIKTDKTVGAGNISTFGDNMSPLDDGSQVYSADAKTIYGSASYSIADLTLTALYGTTEYSAANSDVDEFNLIAEYSITEELSAAVTYVNYDDTGVNSDYDKVFANITYAF